MKTPQHTHSTSLPRSILATSVLSLLALCASAQAGTFNLYTLSGDADSGINADNAYTHAIDINGNGNTTVNGAVFTSTFGGNPGTTNGVFHVPGSNIYTTTGLPNTYGSGYTPPNVGGSVGSMLTNFNYGGNPETLTLNNLRVGQAYTTNFYSDAFGSPGGRLVGVTASDGGSINFDQNIGGSRLEYAFVASATTMTYTITPVVPGDTFHAYAFSNKMEGYKSLFTDNFRAPGNPNTNDVNFQNSLRQGGSLVLAGGPIGYVTNGNTQVGNETGYGGQPYGGDYLLSAFGSRTALNHNFDGAESAGGLSISFDFAPNTIGNGDSTLWESIQLGMSDGDKLTAVNGGAAHFGILFRGNGGIQAFDGSTVVSSAETWGAGSTNVMNHIELLLTDPTDQNPFDGVGQTDIDVFSNGVLVYEFTKGGGGYADNFVNFSNTFIGAADNVSVAQVVPEPTAAVSLISGLGMLLGLRRRRK